MTLVGALNTGGVQKFAFLDQYRAYLGNCATVRLITAWSPIAPTVVVDH